MSHVHKTFSAETLKAAVVNDFPELYIQSFSLINNGWDNVAVLVNGEYIFRFPKDEEVDFDRELRVLSFLRGKISLPIPEVLFVGKTMKYMGYKRIPGGDLTAEIYQSLEAEQKDKLVSDFVRFLSEFHQVFSISEAEAMGITREQPFSYTEKIRAKLPGKVKDVTIEEFILETVEEYNGVMKESAEQVVLYNDLHTENIAFDPDTKKLNGIFDFGDVAIGDINKEFAPLYKLDSKFLEKVISQYEIVTGRSVSLRRVVLHERIQEITDLVLEFIDKPDSGVYKRAMGRIKKWMGERTLYK